MGGHHRNWFGGLEGGASGEEFVEHAAQRVQVGARFGGEVAETLGGHVGKRADDLARLVCGRYVPGDTEVEDLDPTVRGEHEVRRFQVPVHNPGCMGGLQGLGGLCRPVHSSGHLGCTILAEHRVQVSPGKELHHQIEGAVVGVLTQVEDRHHARVVQPAGGSSLAEEQLRAGGVPPVVRQQLDRDSALDHTIAALPDLPHTAPTDERDQLVTAAHNPQAPRPDACQATRVTPDPPLRDHTDDPTPTTCPPAARRNRRLSPNKRVRNDPVAIQEPEAHRLLCLPEVQFPPVPCHHNLSLDVLLLMFGNDRAALATLPACPRSLFPRLASLRKSSPKW